jgi:predicted peroxiredoxin/TusA-related sulfurtransferase
MARVSPKLSVDMRGKKITTFILYHAVMKLSEMSEGDVLEIVTDAFEPIGSDIRAWCRMTGHKLVDFEKPAEGEKYYVQKAAPKEEERKLALVISDTGLEELISPLGFALGSALAGTEVYIYFQGPAVKVLRKGFKEVLHGISRPFSGFARKGLADIGHVPPQDKLRQLRQLGASFYVCGPSMEHFGVEKDDLMFDDVIVSEYLTFLEVMDKADIHIFLQ